MTLKKLNRAVETDGIDGGGSKRVNVVAVVSHHLQSIIQFSFLLLQIRFILKLHSFLELLRLPHYAMARQ